MRVSGFILVILYLIHTADAWAYKITIYEDPGRYGKHKAITGTVVPRRVTFDRCFRGVSAATWEVQESTEPLCLCLLNHRRGRGLSRCFKLEGSWDHIHNLEVLGINDKPTAFTILPADSAQCILVPHYPIHSQETERSAC